MIRSVTLVVCLALAVPSISLACGGYGERYTTLFDLEEVESRVSVITTQKDITTRQKRKARRVLKRAQTAHARYMRDGRFTAKELKVWTKIMTRTHRTLDRIKKRG